MFVIGRGGAPGAETGPRRSYLPRWTVKRGQTPAARRAAACAASSSASSSGGSSLGSSPSAVAVSQSANQAFLGSSGPWRYVPSTVPWAPPRTPSKPLAPSLPWPLRTRPSGVRARSEAGPAAVVLEAGEHAPAAEVDLDRDVADQPRAVLAHRLEVDQPEAGQVLVAERVAVAEQLVAAADAEQDGAAAGGGVQRVALDGGEVARAQRLVAVLAAAEVEEVVRVRVDRVAEPGARQLEADPAPGAAALEQQQVAAVGVDVHQVGIERAHAQQEISHAASPPWSRRARAWAGPRAAARRAGRAPRPPRRDPRR